MQLTHLTYLIQIPSRKARLETFNLTVETSIDLHVSVVSMVPSIFMELERVDMPLH